MEIQEKAVDRKLLLTFSGELDHHGARDALRRIELAIDAALPKTLVLDLGGLTFMDSSGIALILRSEKKMGELDGALRLSHVPTQAVRVLSAAGIDRRLDITK